MDSADVTVVRAVLTCVPIIWCTFFVATDSRYFPDIRLFLPQGAYTDSHTFAHLSGYHVVKVKEPAHHGVLEY